MISVEECLLKKETIYQISNDLIVEFEINNKVAMFVEIKDREGGKLFRLFSEDEVYTYSSLSYKKTTPSGHISFLDLDNFPDGLFLEKIGEDQLAFHIIELKLNPLSDYNRLSRQLMSGYLHCKTIADILHKNDSAEYHFYVGYAEAQTENAIYNNSKRGLRFFTGKSSILEENPEPTKWMLWKDSVINFKLDSFEKQMNFEKVALTTWNDVLPEDESYEHIYASCALK